MNATEPQLNDVQQRIVDSLRAEGIAVVRFDELFSEPSWGEVERDAAGFIQESVDRAAGVGTKPAGKGELIYRRFFKKTVEPGESKKDKKHTFSLGDPFLRVGVSDTLLDVINAYRGRQTKLYYVDNWFTVPYPEADSRIASQRWHRDPEEEHVVKVFLYLSDVDAEAGPFEYVRGSLSGGRYGDLWKWGDDERYPPEDELVAAVAPEDMLSLTGPAGTMILCDTGGFHRGGFARTKPRAMGLWTFISPDAEDGSRHTFRVDFEGREDDVPPQARFALA